jgi:hypothetical protein
MNRAGCGARLRECHSTFGDGTGKVLGEFKEVVDDQRLGR